MHRATVSPVVPAVDAAVGLVSGLLMKEGVSLQGALTGAWSAGVVAADNAAIEAGTRGDPESLIGFTMD
jgi:hypothetical protein